jgi:hypothetical protein
VTLDAELVGTGVYAFTIGPGFVPTATASGSIPKLAALMDLPVAELRAMLKANTLSVEAAGAGFAAAIALAERYRGREISSVQALIDAGIELPDRDREPGASTGTLTGDELDAALDLIRRIRTTLAEQSEGWQERNVFERQWMIRSFRSHAGRPVAEWLDLLERLESAAVARDVAAVLAVRAPLAALADYYDYLYGMAEGYLKDPAKREAQLQIVQSWREDVEQLMKLLDKEVEG